MQKLTFAIGILMLAALQGYAQDEQGQPTDATEGQLTSKNGHVVLPEAGDWAFTFGASGTFSYIGNLINGTDEFVSGPSIEGIGGASISLKKMVTANTAYFAGLSVSADRTKTFGAVRSDVDPDVIGEDELTAAQFSISPSVGIEKRLGSSRLQGIYGISTGMTLAANSRSSASYFNQVTDTNPFPSQGVFLGATVGAPPNNRTRVTESINGGFLSVSVNGFIGAEYFFAPKFSLGSRLFVGSRYRNSFESSTTWELQDGSTTTVTQSGGSRFEFLRTTSGGGIFLVAYF